MGLCNVSVFILVAHHLCLYGKTLENQSHVALMVAYKNISFFCQRALSRSDHLKISWMYFFCLVFVYILPLFVYICLTC